MTPSGARTNPQNAVSMPDMESEEVREDLTELDEEYSWDFDNVYPLGEDDAAEEGDE